MGNTYYLHSNDKGLHGFEKRMIISKLLGGGGCSPPAPPVATALNYLTILCVFGFKGFDDGGGIGGPR
jgi:hypothetical protein